MDFLLTMEVFLMPGLSTTHCGVLRLVKITIKMKIIMEMFNRPRFMKAG